MGQTGKRALNWRKNFKFRLSRMTYIGIKFINFTINSILLQFAFNIFCRLQFILRSRDAREGRQVFKMFPDLINPVQMQFDTKGRLWVATWQTYPHWKPTEAMNDKLLVLEDTDGDGIRDTMDDSDGDGLPDGLEVGKTPSVSATCGATFVADVDPNSKTNPTLATVTATQLYWSVDNGLIWRPMATLAGCATGPVTWHLGAGQRVAAADAIADAVARALDALAGPRGRGELDAELGGAGFTEVVAWSSSGRAEEPRPRGTRWWQGPGLRALATGARITLQREHRRWVTSHQVGVVGEDLVELTTSELPRAPAGRRDLLAAVLEVIGLIDQRPTVTHICRFCHGSFDGLHFHDTLGACHGCSELHLHIVH